MSLSALDIRSRLLFQLLRHLVFPLQPFPPLVCAHNLLLEIDRFSPRLPSKIVSTHKSLQGRVAIIAGGSRGIGAGIALELAIRGANMLITYNKAGTQAAEVIKQLNSKTESAPIKG